MSFHLCKFSFRFPVQLGLFLVLSLAQQFYANFAIIVSLCELLVPSWTCSNHLYFKESNFSHINSPNYLQKAEQTCYYF